MYYGYFFLVYSAVGFPGETNAHPKTEKTPKISGLSDNDKEADGPDDDKLDYVCVSQNLLGVSRGQRGLLEESLVICKGNGILVEILVDREADHTALRLEANRRIAAPSLYMGGNNSP